MTPNEKQEWAISLDGETYTDKYASREEAIRYGKNLFGGDPFWVGECIEPPQPETLWCASDWIEDVACQDEYSIDAAESWAIDIQTKDIRELEESVRKVMGEWLDRTKNRPSFYLIENAERITPEVLK